MGRIFPKVGRIIVFNLLLSIFVIPGFKLSIYELLTSNNKIHINIGITLGIILTFLLAIVEFSWVYVIFMDPGRLSNEIKKRGIESINHFEPCKKCGLPKPPRCHHCKRCGGCILFMDHHCEAIDSCLGYRNYKVFMLVLTYGSFACLYGSFILTTSAFLENKNRGSKISLVIFLIILAIALKVFQNIYIEYSRNNTTTIENIYSTLNTHQNLPRINLLDRGIWRFIPSPPHINPYMYLE